MAEDHRGEADIAAKSAFKTPRTVAALWDMNITCLRSAVPPRPASAVVHNVAGVDEQRRCRAGGNQEHRELHEEGATVIPVFSDELYAYSSKLDHGPIAGNWEMDGFHLVERWWFA